MSKRTTVFTLIAAVLLVLVMPGCSRESVPTLIITSPPPSNNQTLPLDPVDIVSVVGPIPPYNPGGPVIEFTMKNVGSEPVIYLNVNLKLEKDVGFTFYDVTPSTPLLPGKIISGKLFLIGPLAPGFSNGVSYSLTINGTLQNGISFIYPVQVQITAPAP